MGQFRRERRICLIVTSARIVEHKVQPREFLCPNCVSSTKKSDDLYCRYFKHYITSKITACPRFKLREMFL